MQRLTITLCLVSELLTMGCTKNETPVSTVTPVSQAAAADDSFPAGLDFAREEAAKGRNSRYLGYHWVHAQVPAYDDLRAFGMPEPYGNGMDIFRRVQSPDAKSRKKILQDFFGRPPTDFIAATRKYWSFIPARYGYVLTMSRTRSAPTLQKTAYFIVVTDLGDLWIVPKVSSHPSKTDWETRDFLSVANAPPAHILTYRLEEALNRRGDAAPP